VAEIKFQNMKISKKKFWKNYAKGEKLHKILAAKKEKNTGH